MDEIKSKILEYPSKDWPIEDGYYAIVQTCIGGLKT